MEGVWGVGWGWLRGWGGGGGGGRWWGGAGWVGGGGGCGSRWWWAWWGCVRGGRGGWWREAGGGLGGLAVVVGGDGLPRLGEVAVADLPHVEVEPFGVVEPLGGGLAAGGVVGHQVSAAVAFLKSLGHGGDDPVVIVVLDRAVAAQD